MLWHLKKIQLPTYQGKNLKNPTCICTTSDIPKGPKIKLNHPHTRAEQIQPIGEPLHTDTTREIECRAANTTGGLQLLSLQLQTHHPTPVNTTKKTTTGKTTQRPG